MELLVIAVIAVVAVVAVYGGRHVSERGFSVLGPVLFWVGLFQIVALCYQYYLDRSRFDPGPEIAALKRTNATTAQILAQTKSDLDKRVDELLTASASHKAELLTTRRNESDRQATVLDRLQDIGADRRSLSIVDSVPREAVDTAAILHRHELIVREAEHLRQQHLAPASTASADNTRELLQLRDRMAVRMNEPSYAIELHPDNEMIKGRRGKYYAIDLKDAEAGIRFQFEGGRYVLDRRSDAFRSALNKFLADIVTKLQGNVSYDLLVRGSADITAFRNTRQLEPSFPYQRIKYMTAIPGGDRYSTVLGEQLIGQNIRNEDLPNLRAAFLQDLIGKNYPVQPPIVLEGAVTKKADNNDRNAEIFLFVNW